MNPYQQIRQQSLMGGYDQLTPDMGGMGGMQYNDDPFMAPPPPPGLTSVADQQQSGYELGTEPEVQPELPFTPQAPTVDKPYGNQTSYDPREAVKRTMDLVNQVYTPENSSRDRFNNLLDHFPERYTPNKSDRFSAVLMGLGAGGRQGGDPLKTMDQVLQAPYIRDVEEWKTKADPFGKAYQFENNSNTNERQLATGVVQAQTQADRLAEQARQADARAENVRQRNLIADYVAKGAKVVSLPHSPTIIMAGPDGKPFNTGIPTGALSEAESIRAKGEWADKAADTRAASTAANQQGEMVTYTDPTTGKQSPGQRVGNTIYPLEMAQPGQRPGQRQAPAAGPGTSVPITAPGTAPGQPAAPRAPGKPVTGAVYKTGTEHEAKALTPLEERMKVNNEIAGIISRHRNWKNFVGYNEDTKLYEGMLDPPQAPRTAGWFGIGGGGASDEEWTQYKNDMDGYNQLRSLLHPGAPPLKVVGGSNAEQKAAREKAAREKPTTTTSTVEPTKGIGPSSAPSSSTSSAPTTSTIGPTNIPNNPKSLPGGGSSTSTASTTTTIIPPTPSSDTGGRGASPEYPYGTWGARPKPNTPKTTTAPSTTSTTPLPTNEPNTGPDPIPERAAAAIPRGSKVDVNGNTFRYTDPKGNVRYWSRETGGWVDYDPTSGPRRRR